LFQGCLPRRKICIYEIKKLVQDFGEEKKPEGMRPLVRNRPTWEDNIKTDLKKLGFNDVNCIYLQ